MAHAFGSVQKALHRRAWLGRMQNAVRDTVIPIDRDHLQKRRRSGAAPPEADADKGRALHVSGCQIHHPVCSGADSHRAAFSGCSERSAKRAVRLIITQRYILMNEGAVRKVPF